MPDNPLSDLVHYAAPTARDRLAGLTCLAYGSSANRRDRGDQPALGSYAVVYVYAGSGWIETTATTSRIAVEAGDLFWLFPGVAHTCLPGPTGWSVQWAAFAGPMAHSFELLGLLSRVRPVVRPPDGAQVEALFDQLRADSTGGEPLAGLLGAALIHRLVVVARNQERESDPAPRAMALQRAVSLIEAGALQPIDLHAVADECGVGYSTLRRRFKELTGQSITDYLLRARLNRAKELLALTPMLVADVAHAVGFVDPYYFSRLFHLKEGVTPTAFRARERAQV